MDPTSGIVVDADNGTSGIIDSTMLNEAPTLTVRASIKAAILAVMAGASLIANSTTLISIAVNRRHKNSTVGSNTLYTLLFQMAVADTLVSLWCLSGEAAWTYTVEWKGGHILCKVFKFSQVFSLYLSTSTMVLIGFDRLSAVRWPINHRSCFWPIGSAWLVSALLASPQLAVFRVLQGPFRQPFHQCVTYGFYTEEWQEQLYSIFSLLTMFVIPLVALTGCYICIFYTINREKERALLTRGRRNPSSPKGHPTGQGLPSTRLDEGQQDGQNGNIHHHKQRQSVGRIKTDPRRHILERAKKRSLKISIIIVSAFVVCWTPYYFMMITFIFVKPDDKLGEEMQSAIFFFGMSNSLINPLIYGAFHLCRRPSRQRKLGRTRAGSFSIALTETIRRRTDEEGNTEVQGLRRITTNSRNPPREDAEESFGRSNIHSLR